MDPGLGWLSCLDGWPRSHGLIFTASAPRLASERGRRRGTPSFGQPTMPTLSFAHLNGVSRYPPAYRIEGQKEYENGAASPFLLLRLVSDDEDWPHNDNRVHGKCYRRMNGRH
jgi:hypothetical protein